MLLYMKHFVLLLSNDIKHSAVVQEVDQVQESKLPLMVRPAAVWCSLPSVCVCVCVSVSVSVSVSVREAKL